MTIACLILCTNLNHFYFYHAYSISCSLHFICYILKNSVSEMGCAGGGFKSSDYLYHGPGIERDALINLAINAEKSFRMYDNVL